MPAHQCARFYNDPIISHERPVKRIIRYLLDTRDKGILILQTRPHKGIGMLLMLMVLTLLVAGNMAIMTLQNLFCQGQDILIIMVKDRIFHHVCRMYNYWGKQITNRICSEYNIERVYYSLSRHKRGNSLPRVDEGNTIWLVGRWKVTHQGTVRILRRLVTRRPTETAGSWSIFDIESWFFSGEQGD